MKRNTCVSPKRTRQISLKIAALALIGSAAAMATVSAHAFAPFFNTAPVAQAGGPYTIHLGESLVVNGSTSFDPDAGLVGDFITDYRWDLSADGLYEGFGVSDTFTALELANAGISDIGIFTLRLAVTDTFGGVGSQTISFEVLAPAGTAVPEPGSLSLFGLGLGLAGAIALRRKEDMRSLGPHRLMQIRRNADGNKQNHRPMFRRRLAKLKCALFSGIAIAAAMIVAPANAGCMPGEKQCQSGSVMRCNDNGTRWIHHGERCGSGYGDRFPESDRDRRSFGGCTPGEKQCQAGSVMRCNDNGTRWIHHGERCR